MRRLRSGPFQVHIKGLDELSVTHDNVMFEACNTSFQVHLQVEPGDFAQQYNLSTTWPRPCPRHCWPGAVNSPILLGHRLWQETRLALFQHAVDERSGSGWRAASPPGSAFGDRWLQAAR